MGLQASTTNDSTVDEFMLRGIVEGGPIVSEGNVMETKKYLLKAAEIEQMPGQ